MLYTSCRQLCRPFIDTLRDKNTLRGECSLSLCFPGDGDAIQDYLLKITGARSVPRVFVGQQCIGGGTETREAHEKGTLVPLLKKAGAL